MPGSNCKVILVTEFSVKKVVSGGVEQSINAFQFRASCFYTRCMIIWYM